ncbi:hypothetical protein [Thermoclostridium stercorarium]
MLTIGLYGNTDFYYLKGIVEQLLVQMNIKNADFSPEKIILLSILADAQGYPSDRQQ